MDFSLLSSAWSSSLLNNFTGSFLLLFPRYFASCDSVKTLVKHTTKSPLRPHWDKLQLPTARVYIITVGWMHELTRTGTGSQMKVNGRHINWVLAQHTPSDSQLPMTIYHSVLKPHHQASLRRAGLPHSALLSSALLCCCVWAKCPEQRCVLKGFSEWTGLWLHLTVNRNSVPVLLPLVKKEILMKENNEHNTAWDKIKHKNNGIKSIVLDLLVYF